MTTPVGPTEDFVACRRCGTYHPPGQHWREEPRDLGAEIDKLTARVAELEAQVNTQPESLAFRIERLEGRLVRNSERVGALSTEVAALRLAVATNEPQTARHLLSTYSTNTAGAPASSLCPNCGRGICVGCPPAPPQEVRMPLSPDDLARLADEGKALGREITERMRAMLACAQTAPCADEPSTKGG